MNLTKKFLSVLTATICAASACVCSISVSAELTSSAKTSGNLNYVTVDEDEDGIDDFVRITSCDLDAESVLIPKAIEDLVVKEISDGAFANATSLISIDVNSQNSYFSADDGVLFNKGGSTLICYPSAKAATSYVIPGAVSTIGDAAFANCAKMETVTIPSSVTSIGDEAFTFCTSLADISIPSSVQSVGRNAFTGTELLNYQIKNDMGPLYYADSWVIFADSTVKTVMSASTPIKAGTTGIAGGAFSGCSDLTKIDIPSGVLYIAEYAFAGASSLSAISIPTTTKTIGEYAFANCGSLIELEIPNSVSTIGHYAFAYNTNLTEINIPSGVSVIAESTFEGCSSLLEIIIPVNVEKIEKLAFYNCSSLKKVTIINKACEIKDAPQTFSNSESSFSGTFYANEGSTTQAYAKTYNRLFEITGSANDEPKPTISGDANGDGKTNVRDCAFIASALANGTGDTLPLAADFNEDGKINVRDAAALANHLAGAK